MPKISCIVTTFNHYHLTWHLIDSLYRTARRSSYELIIVDNLSTDATPSLAKFADRFITNSVPRNLAHSLNLGIDAAQGEFLFILNNDVILLSSDWDERFNTARAQHPHAVIIPLTVEGEGFSPMLYDLARQTAAPSQVALEPLHRHLEMACVGFSRRILEDCGPFNEALPMWYHHQDYYVRLRRNKIPIYRCHSILARHVGNATIAYTPNTPGVEHLRREYDRFLTIHDAESLQKIGLRVPEFGPVDLVEGPTTITVDDLHLPLRWDGGP